jgi:FkbM family methyltransferase
MKMEFAKRWIRNLEAHLLRRTRTFTVVGQSFECYRSRWWDDSQSDKDFLDDIAPYFEVLPHRSLRGVVDAGAALGLFAIPMLMANKSLQVAAFEPSKRQRILLKRNLVKNSVADRVQIYGEALWNKPETLRFRSHGYMSGIRGVSGIPDAYPHEERVPASTLDSWAQKNSGFPIDLIKMDIEGAEIEALEGARTVLFSQKPDCIIQAYHIRDGRRTLEPCREILESAGYVCHEHKPPAGTLVGMHPSRT